MKNTLILYKDFLAGKGHEITTTYQTGDEMIDEIDKLTSDVYMIDFRLPGSKNGVDIPIEILTRIPSAPILFITAYEQLDKEISNNPVFYNKNIEVLVKPVKLDIIESTIFDLVKKSQRMNRNSVSDE
jgi:DNA-binding NtrC family response regulator